MGTGVQPLQGENYTYSRVLGHVQLWIWHHTIGRTTYIFLPPSSTTFPARIAAEVRGEGVPAPNRVETVVVEDRRPGVQDAGAARVERCFG